MGGEREGWDTGTAFVGLAAITPVIVAICSISQLGFTGSLHGGGEATEVGHGARSRERLRGHPMAFGADGAIVYCESDDVSSTSDYVSAGNCSWRGSQALLRESTKHE